MFACPVSHTSKRVWILEVPVWGEDVQTLNERYQEDRRQGHSSPTLVKSGGYILEDVFNLTGSEQDLAISQSSRLVRGPNRIALQGLPRNLVQQYPNHPIFSSLN
jgi:hypothetical protein